MRYPTIPVRAQERSTVAVFRGLNRGPRPGEDEFREMENLSSDAYPVLSPRPRRGTYRKPASPQGLAAMDKLCYVDGADLVLGDTVIPMDLSVAPEDCPKVMQSMGAYLIILPDKKYINTAKPEDRGSIEASVSVGDVQFTLCREDGGEYTGATVSATAPEEPENGQLWLDTGSSPHALRQYSTSQGEWVSIASTYVKLTAGGIGTGFSVFDAVTISGCVQGEWNGSFVLWGVGEDYVVVEGLLTEAFTQEQPLTLERRMPDMDFITECGNRLWGCRYGSNAQGQQVNEIYCSKLGDFRNWSCYMGLSTDSYAASCGTPGPFTGAASQLGYPLFFKEDCIHKVYGMEPASFQIQVTPCRGVQPGCQRSLARVGDLLVYKSRDGVCAYDGSLPVVVSQSLGKERYHSAVAGALGDKYYISMADSADQWHLFVWDSYRNLWHREDSLRCSAFCAWGEELFAIDEDSRNILGLLGSGEQEEPVCWSAETGELGLMYPERKYISRLNLYLSLEPGSRLEIEARYDGGEAYEQLCVIFGTALQSIRLPLRPRRCSHMQLRLRGTGGAKIYSITKIMEKGSDQM